MNEYTLDELMKEVYRRSLYNEEQSQKALDEVISENIDLKNENQRLNNIIDELEKCFEKNYFDFNDDRYREMKEIFELKEGKQDE